MARNPAVALFLQRAEAIDPSFMLSDDNRTPVADLCAQLDVLQKQATAICEKAAAEIERARRADQRERRAKQKKVRQDRRR